MSFFKGSTEADTMLAKKTSIRSAGLKTEKKFFGPRGVFAKAGHVKHLQSASRNPKLTVPEKHMIKIALDTVNNPMKALLGGPSVEEAKAILRRYGIPYLKKNPITVVGNPSKRINTGVAGVLYNRCVEIRAEKTSAGKLKGLYYHPFLRSSKVCVLALDNGDILIHSQVGETLWKLD